MRLSVAALLVVAVSAVSARPPQGGNPNDMRNQLMGMLMNAMKNGGGPRPDGGPPGFSFPPMPHMAGPQPAHPPFGQMGMRQPMRPPQPTPSFGPRPGGFGGFNQGPPPGQWSPPGGNVFMGPAPNQRPPQNQWGGPGPRGPPRPQGNQAGGSGLLMDMPGAGAGGYGYGGGYGGGFGAPGTILGQLKMQCPQGQMVFATGADKCKDLVILEAIYDAKTMRPLYRWVPPLNQMDPTSIPDNLKDQIQNVLIQKVQSQPNRMATPKQKALQNALGDPPNYAKPMFGIMI